MKYFALEPEVAGEIGPDSEVDYSVFPPNVTKLSYRFHGWLGDDIIESFPCYLVTERLKAQLEIASLTGYRFDSAEISTSSLFHDLYSDRALPNFVWLIPTGVAGVDDFGLSATHQLIISDQALEHLTRFQLDHCDITEVQQF
jgi:hypothetical protein